jgi:hypothetical protein
VTLARGAAPGEVIILLDDLPLAHVANAAGLTVEAIRLTAGTAAAA